jgi:hypothetical protein
VLLLRGEDGEFEWLLPDEAAPRDCDCELFGDCGDGDGRSSLAGDRGRELALLSLLLRGEDGGVMWLANDVGSCNGDWRGE